MKVEIGNVMSIFIFKTKNLIGTNLSTMAGLLMKGLRLDSVMSLISERLKRL